MTVDQQTVVMQLTARQAARTALLASAITLVENDVRVVAAWLFGSGHRGDADAFSDIDLWTVLDDGQIAAVVANRHSYVTQLGEPLLTLDVAGNAPVGGGYLMLQYPGPVGPVQVDWYWQPQAAAVIPDDAHVLFDRVGLPRAVGAKTIDVCYLARGIMPPPPAVEPTPAQRLAHELTFFWCMALIAAKDVARHEQNVAGWLLHYAAQKLDCALALVSGIPTTAYADRITAPETLPLAETMRLVQELHQAATQLLPHLTAWGGAIPAALVPAIQRFFDLAKATSQLDGMTGLVRRTT
jgi:predicted nucleotidyltransferase